MDRIETVTVIGLGHVGLSQVMVLAEKYRVIGYDINSERIAELWEGYDRTVELTKEQLESVKSTLRFMDKEEALSGVTVFIIAVIVPTPIDASKRPDLTLLVKSTEAVGRILKQGDTVVYESTVYPDLTEEVCVPVLEKQSGLLSNRDFRRLLS